MPQVHGNRQVEVCLKEPVGLHQTRDGGQWKRVFLIIRQWWRNFDALCIVFCSWRPRILGRDDGMLVQLASHSATTRLERNSYTLVLYGLKKG